MNLFDTLENQDNIFDFLEVEKCAESADAPRKLVLGGTAVTTTIKLDGR